MSYLNFKSKYDRFPTNKVKGFKANVGYQDIIVELKKRINQENYIICIDTYPGVNDEEVLNALKELNGKVYQMIDIFKDEKTINEQLRYQLTDDRVFGKMYYGEIIDFMDEEKLSSLKENLKDTQGLKIVYGFGARLIEHYDLFLYLDLARWEIQLRYRNGATNYKANNSDEDILRKYKRAFFVEWRIADKHKIKYFDDIDYLIDTNKANNPKMISGEALRSGLKSITNHPFRLTPYFDPGVWGGQWMKEVCNLDPSKSNYAWSFDGVPEENSLLLDYEGEIIELPAMDLVLYLPKELLGNKVYSRFGAEFPIRFDFLDTMEGQNLSLQVHPLTEYIKKQFGMTYTQDESYYILDAKEDAHVYLGLKENVNSSEMIEDLKIAQSGKQSFDADKYINKFPAKKHDHFLIPAGTCHCSGSGSMVLEISATPYIFTFKLWDWNRLGLDGLPRPVHIDHGAKVIQWDRTTNWVKDNLVNATYTIKDDENPNAFVEHTGLHELEFIETIRYSFSEKTIHHTLGNVNMLNLIEGEEAIVESLNNEFEPFIVHYAETFIIPAKIKDYTITPYGNSVNKEIKVIKAFVR